MTWDENDFWSEDPITRFNAHQAAKGRRQWPDPDDIRKEQKENAPPSEEPDPDGPWDWARDTEAIDRAVEEDDAA